MGKLSGQPAQHVCAGLPVLPAQQRMHWHATLALGMSRFAKLEGRTMRIHVGKKAHALYLREFCGKRMAREADALDGRRSVCSAELSDI